MRKRYAGTGSTGVWRPVALVCGVLFLAGPGAFAEPVPARCDAPAQPAGGEVATRAMTDETSRAAGELGLLLAGQGRTDEALASLRRAVFAAQQANTPDLLYQWEWQVGRLLRARGDEEGALAAYRRALYQLQSIRQDLAAAYAAERLSFREQVGPVFHELADLLLRRAARAPADEGALLDEAVRTIERLKAAELQDYFRDDCVAQLDEQVVPLEQVAAHTAVLYPILLPDRPVMLLRLAGATRQFPLSMGVGRLRSEARGLRAGLSAYAGEGFLPHARRLYDALLRPLEAELAAHAIDTVVVVPDGPLRTIPFAVLHDGSRFLIEKYALALSPGLTLTDPQPLARAPRRLLLAGLSEAVQGFRALPGVPHELDAIAALYQGSRLQDESFAVANVAAELERHPYAIVHLATHGKFEADTRDSFLLTYDGKLTMDRLEELIGAGRAPVELLTLSACQTAVGDERAALGLAGVAVKAGARSALATLWSIDDTTATHLIPEFYRLLRDGTVSKAEALRRAQRVLIERAELRHPGFWSPFLLIGNWL